MAWGKVLAGAVVVILVYATMAQAVRPEKDFVCEGFFPGLVFCGVWGRGFVVGVRGSQV